MNEKKKTKIKIQFKLINCNESKWIMNWNGTKKKLASITIGQKKTNPDNSQKHCQLIFIFIFIFGSEINQFPNKIQCHSWQQQQRRRQRIYHDDPREKKGFSKKYYWDNNDQQQQPVNQCVIHCVSMLLDNLVLM